MEKYKTILIDPPYQLKLTGLYQRRKFRPAILCYPTMTSDEIKSLSIDKISDIGCHLWLWTTNQTLSLGFELLQHWGFRYLAPIHWKKPSGCGNYFIHLTQTLLFGYKKKCVFNKARYKPNFIETSLPKRHSEKPEESYKYIESISDEPRLELFSRKKRQGWTCLGNEINGKDIHQEIKRLAMDGNYLF